MTDKLINTEAENVRITSFSAENFLRIKFVDITIDPAGGITVIGGDNKQGKSSVLIGFAATLGGEKFVPDDPVNNVTGAEEAFTEVATSNGWKIRRTYEKYKDEDGKTKTKTKLKISIGAGATLGTAQTLLTDIFGKLGFDPMAFLELKPKEQENQLKKLVGLDFAELDQQRSDHYDSRGFQNRRVHEMKIDYERMPSHDDLPDEEISIKDAVDELGAAEMTNRKISVGRDLYSQLVKDRETYDSGIAKHQDDILRIKSDIAQLENLMESRDTDISELQNAHSESLEKSAALTEKFKANPEINTEPIKLKISSAEDTNEKIRENKAKYKKQIEMIDANKLANGYTEKIKAIDKEKARLIAAADMPIENLNFTEKGLTYNDFLLDQASDAERVAVSMAITTSLSPNARFAIVRRGSDLDDNSLRALDDHAKKYNVQLIVERVSQGDECTVVMEDGRVKTKIFNRGDENAEEQSDKL